jgi:hypothetical protein
MHVNQNCEVTKCNGCEHLSFNIKKTKVCNVLNCKGCDHVCIQNKTEPSENQIKLTSLKFYNCPYCQFTSKYNSSLKKHLNLHVQHNCPYCCFTHNKLPYLHLHVKKFHDEEFIFCCYLCNYKTNSKLIIKNHLKVIHNKI